MEVSESLSRKDKSLQLVNRDIRPLGFIDKLKGGCDDIETLEEMIDVDRDLERYSKKIRPQQIYKMGWFENKNGLYRISREVELSVLTEPVLLRIVNNLRML